MRNSVNAMCVKSRLGLGFVLSVLMLIQTVQAQTLSNQTLSIAGDDYAVRVPQGFEIEVLSTELSGPRVIHRVDDALLIGSKSGSVFQLTPPYNNPLEIATLNDYPHSVVVHKSYLYVAHTSGVIRTSWPIDESKTPLPLSNKQFEQVAFLPGGGGHNSRTLKLGPDNRLYVSLGITGNCSNEYLDGSYPWNDQRGGFFVLEEAPSKATSNEDKIPSAPSTHIVKPYASGLRNPVGFDWHPVTNVMYASNNGPDHLGYELPRESFAKVTDGSFHGMPWFQWDGDQLKHDPCIEVESPRSGTDVSAPVATFPARIAPMDVGFVNTDHIAWQSYEHDAIVALHGSWATSDGGGRGDPASRREPMLVRVEFDDEGNATGEVHDFIDGFQLEDGSRWARPMGVAFDNEGSLFFTSDGGIHGLFRLKPAD